MLNSTCFERYREPVAARGAIPRLVAGTLLIGATWLVVTLLVMASAFFLQVSFGESDLTFRDVSPLDSFVGTRLGFFAALLTFGGIWAGIWLVMRILHREPLFRLLGVDRKLSTADFCKGFAAVLLTSLLAELAMYLLSPGLGRNPIPTAEWLLFALPVTLAAFVQTSSEELLFRGYLLRGLARRYRSPMVWAVFPTLAFTLLHWNTAAPLMMNLAVMASIGAFAAMLALLVYVTGNLGAAMGAHLANNLTGFLFISHDDAFNSFALFKAAPLQSFTSTPAGAILIVTVSLVSVALSVLLLLPSASPLRLRIRNHAACPQHGQPLLP